MWHVPRNHSLPVNECFVATARETLSPQDKAKVVSLVVEFGAQALSLFIGWLSGWRMSRIGSS